MTLPIEEMEEDKIEDEVLVVAFDRFCCFQCHRFVNLDSYDLSLECCTRCTMMVMMRQNMERRAMRANIEADIPPPRMYCVQCRDFVSDDAFSHDLQCCLDCVEGIDTRARLHEHIVRRSNEIMIAQMRREHITGDSRTVRDLIVETLAMAIADGSIQPDQL